MKCEHCGIDFVSTNNQRKYCSVECRRAAERARARQAKIAAGAPVEWVACPVCKRQFKRHVGSGKQFCSSKCKQAAARIIERKRAKRQAANVIVKKCAACGKEFETCNSSRKYCSHECYDKNRYAEIKTYHAQTKAQDLTDKTVGKATKTLDDWSREAYACGLDYGTYRAMIAAGKSFEELKAQYERRRPTA